MSPEFKGMLIKAMNRMIPVGEADCYHDLHDRFLIDPVLFKVYYKKYTGYTETDYVLEFIRTNIVKNKVNLIKL